MLAAECRFKSSIGAGAGALMSLGSAATIAVGATVGIAAATFYWVAQNNDVA